MFLFPSTARDRPQSLAHILGPQTQVQRRPLMQTYSLCGDLAFCGMALGKEGMSGKWCLLCKMAATQMADLNASGEDWKEIDEMKQVAVEYKKKLE
jgi:hypothetical protein